MKAFRPWWTVDLASGLPVVGSRASFSACARYVHALLQQGCAMPKGGCPMLIGETGIPFDLGGLSTRMRTYIYTFARTPVLTHMHGQPSDPGRTHPHICSPPPTPNYPAFQTSLVYR